VIDLLRPQQQAEVAHRNRTLAGPDGMAHPVSWWFAQPTRDFMAALADPQNGWIVSGNPGASRFVSELIAPNNAMGYAFEQSPPGTGGKTCRALAVTWIANGCPLPPLPAPQEASLRLNSPRKRFERHSTGMITGMGAVH